MVMKSRMKNVLLSCLVGGIVFSCSGPVEMAGTTGISRKTSADQTAKPGSPEPFESLPEAPGVPPVLPSH